MRQLLRSLATAFSMYSSIPVPRVEWREENMRYVMCFFPLGRQSGVGCGFAGNLELARLWPLSSARRCRYWFQAESISTASAIRSMRLHHTPPGSESWKFSGTRTQARLQLWAAACIC